MGYISKEELFRGLFNLLKEVQAEEPGACILLLDSVLKARFFGKEEILSVLKNILKQGVVIEIICGACLESRFEDLKNDYYTDRHPILKLAHDYENCQLFMKTSRGLEEEGIIIGSKLMIQKIDNDRFVLNRNEVKIRRILDKYSKQKEILEKGTGVSYLRYVEVGRGYGSSETWDRCMLSNDFRELLNKWKTGNWDLSLEVKKNLLKKWCKQTFVMALRIVSFLLIAVSLFFGKLEIWSWDLVGILFFSRLAGCFVTIFFQSYTIKVLWYSVLAIE